MLSFKNREMTAEHLSDGMNHDRSRAKVSRSKSSGMIQGTTSVSPMRKPVICWSASEG